MTSVLARLSSEGNCKYLSLRHSGYSSNERDSRMYYYSNLMEYIGIKLVRQQTNSLLLPNK
jgi:hypothetical protein